MNIHERMDDLRKIVWPPTVTHIVYHANCYDGFGGAFAGQLRAHSVGRALPELVPCSYGDPIPELPGNAVVAVVDFSWPRAQMIALAESVLKLVVLDHHEKARLELADLPWALFENEHSGCILAWWYFFPRLDPPLFLRYIEDRDLWKWALPNSRAINLGISLVSQTFEDFKHWSETPNKSMRLAELCVSGESVGIYRRKQIESALERAFPAIICGKLAYGREVHCVNCSPDICSEVGEALLAKYPDEDFAATCWIRSNGLYQFSLRSDRYDVNKCANYYGGGGHKAAAGFKCVRHNQVRWFEGVMIVETAPEGYTA